MFFCNFLFLYICQVGGGGGGWGHHGFKDAYVEHV